MTRSQRAVKRAFDIGLALTGLALSGWLIVLAVIAARLDTGQPGIFRQRRIGLDGRGFMLLKIRTMRDARGQATTVTTAGDPRITRLGRLLRRTKLDELPQLLNVLAGDMSFVGPRPDVAGFADMLQGEDRLILSVRPGITGPATLRFRDEERLLADCDDPERYNRDVIFPEKVRLNLDYIRNYRFSDDLKLIWRTVCQR